MAKLVPSLTLLVAFLFLFGCTDDNNPATSFQVGPASLFVANMTTLSVINLETATVANDIFGLGNAPNDMIVAANTLIVLNSISNDLNFFRVNRDGSLSVDGTADVGLAQNNNPWAAAMDGSGHLLITNMMQNSISVFSLTSRTIERTVPAGIAPGPILVLGNHAYVGNTGYDFGTYSYGVGTIWKYDLETGSIVDSIEVGTNPQDVGLDPLGQLHVVCTGNYADIPGRIYVVQPAPLSIIRIIEIGGTPNRVAFASDSAAYLSAGGWGMSGESTGWAMKYRYDTGEVLRGAEHPVPVGLGANDIAVSQDGRIFVSCFSDNCVCELGADSVVATYAVGTGPSAIVLWQ